MALTDTQRKALKKYMGGSTPDAAARGFDLTGDELVAMFYGLDRLDRLALERELLLDSSRELAGIVVDLQTRVARHASRGKGDRGATGLRNTTVALGVVIDKRGVLTKELDAVDAALRGRKRVVQKNTIAVKE
jgi:hypothetical protein